MVAEDLDLHSVSATLAPFLGPTTQVSHPSVIVQYEHSRLDQLTITLSAIHDLHLSNSSDSSQSSYDHPSIYLKWLPFASANASSLSFFGFQCSEFALPVSAASIDLDFNFFDRPGYTRPKSVFPFICCDSQDDKCLLLAPLDTFHEQVLAVNTLGQRELRFGWSGDLEYIPAGFTSTLGIFIGSSPRELLFKWGECVRQRAGKSSPRSQLGRYSDNSTASLSYWTDNGASYWYRSEKGLDLPSTLEKTINLLDDAQVPVDSVELDSWFYDHEIPRLISDIDYPDVVPPTGMLRWEPRVDALKEGGVSGLRKRLNQRPLILHSRHISSKSSYIDQGAGNEDWWISGDRAHPKTPALWNRWMAQASDWGATCYEQDWLVEIWQSVHQLRTQPHRIADWQIALDDAASNFGIALIWCMATPADFAQAVSLKNVCAIRTSDDYRYAEDAADLWWWHLTVNCLARSLGLWPFKDVFMSHTNKGSKVDIEGDPNCELEACLSALSAGPVGIGDRLGRTNKNIVMRTCRSDGVLIKPDVPLCAMDRSLLDNKGMLWADTESGKWRYIMAINASRKEEAERRDDPVVAEELDIEEALVYDWKTGKAMVTSCLAARLRAHEWALWIVCPLHRSSVTKTQFAMIGDTSVYATMGDRRMRTHKDNVGRFDVLGVPGEKVTVAYWTRDKGVTRTSVRVGASAYTTVDIAKP